MRRERSAASSSAAGSRGKTSSRSARSSRARRASGSHRSRCARRSTRTPSRSFTAPSRARCGTGSGPSGASTRSRSRRSRTASTSGRGSPASSRCCSATRTRSSSARARLPAEDLWAAHRSSKQQLLDFVADDARRARARPRRPHDRLRAPLRHLQARKPPLQPARAARAAPRRPRAPDPGARRREGAPGGRGREGSDPARRRLRAGARGGRARRLPRGLRDDARATARAGRRRLAQHAAAAVRGVGHLGDEGGAERRAQLLDPRRLVGRGVLPGVRVRDRRRCGGRCDRDRAGRGRRRGALHGARGTGAPGVLRAGRGAACRSAGSR